MKLDIQSESEQDIQKSLEYLKHHRIFCCLFDYHTGKQYPEVQVELSEDLKYLTLKQKNQSENRIYRQFRKYTYFKKIVIKKIDALINGPHTSTF